MTNASYSVLLFAQLQSRAGPKSPFPTTQLVAHAKPTLQVGAASQMSLSVCARDLLDEGLGAHRQPLPNSLMLWVGDASKRDAEVQVQLEATSIAEGEEGGCGGVYSR